MDLKDTIQLRIVFYDRIHFSGTTSCIWWTGTINNKGYGVFGTGGKMYQAHRLSWIIHRGPIPPGKWVLHTCDARKCVNPEHLYLGTIKENNADRTARKRHPHHIDDNIIARIQSLREYAPDIWSYKNLAKTFKVSLATVQKIVKKQNKRYRGVCNQAQQETQE
jgi:HNH endonuclease/Mitochondrial ribosomal protein subunit L20